MHVYIYTHTYINAYIHTYVHAAYVDGYIHTFLHTYKQNGGMSPRHGRRTANSSPSRAWKDLGCEGL